MTTPVAARNPALPIQAAPLPIDDAAAPAPVVQRLTGQPEGLAPRTAAREAGVRGPRQPLASLLSEPIASSSNATAAAAEAAEQRPTDAAVDLALRALHAKRFLDDARIADIVDMAVNPALDEGARQALAEGLARHPKSLSALYCLADARGATDETLSTVAAALGRRQTIEMTGYRVPQLLALPEPARLALALAQQAYDVERMQTHGRHRSGFYQIDLELASRSQMFAQAIHLTAPLADSQELARLVGEEFQRWKSGDDTDGIRQESLDLRLHALQALLKNMHLHPVLQRAADGDPLDQSVMTRVAHQQWVFKAAFMYGSLPSASLDRLGSTLQSLERLRAPLLRDQLTELLALNVHASGDADAYLQFAAHFHRSHMRTLPIALFPLLAQGEASGPPSAKLLTLLGASTLRNSRMLYKALKDLMLMADSECPLSPQQRRQLLEHAIPEEGTASQQCIGFLENLRFLAIAVQCAREDVDPSSEVFDILAPLADSEEKPVLTQALSAVLRRAMPGAAASGTPAGSLDRWESYLSSWRQPEALLVYAQNIRANLDEDEGRDAVLESLNRFADSAVWAPENLFSFRALRYSSAASDHLAKVAENAPEAYAQWQQPVALSEAPKPYAIEDTDHPEDLLLCGTDVSSCQSVDASVEQGRALMGYVLDGKHRLLVAKSQDGAMAARRVVRILIDEGSQQPVLYLEKLYANAGIDKNGPVDKALVQLARLKAQAMGCDLVSGTPGDEETPYDRVLQSLGSSAPFEYVDADHVRQRDGSDSDSDGEDGEVVEGGVVKGGRYTVTKAYLLQ